MSCKFFDKLRKMLNKLKNTINILHITREVIIKNIPFYIYMYILVNMKIVS